MNTDMPSQPQSATQRADGQQKHAAQSARPTTASLNVREMILAYYRGEIDEERWAAFNERWFHETYRWYPGLEAELAAELAAKMIAEGADAPDASSGEPPTTGASVSAPTVEHPTDAAIED